jgi:hypothetical protein
MVPLECILPVTVAFYQEVMTVHLNWAGQDRIESIMTVMPKVLL